MTVASQEFYRLGVPEVSSLLELYDGKQFVSFPPDWHVMITDVIGSTAAIQAGRYKEVNAMGATSITAVLNALDREEIPYVFGGDGATFVLHESQKERALYALNGVRNLAKSSFSLDLRVGSVPVSEVRKAGFDVTVCKYRVTEGYTQALFFGGGIDQAETLIKQDRNWIWQTKPDPEAVADPAGLECRWDQVPSVHGEIVALLVKSMENDPQRRLQEYRKILAKINEIYKVEGEGHPVAFRKMRTTLSKKKLSIEQRIQNFRRRDGKPVTPLSVWFKSFLGRVFDYTEKTVWPVTWSSYKNTVRENADYRKFDDMLRLLLSGNESQRLQLRTMLEAESEKGRIVFGTHVSPSTLITCMVLDRTRRHTHFVDGSQGGYALAAAELKGQLKKLAGAG